MKKIIALLIMGILLTVSAATAQNEPVTIQSVTGLGDVQEKLDQGIQIEKVYYTDGYGFSTSEFTTDDPEEIRQLWEAVNAITVGEKVNESITDWYPQIIFYLTDGTYGSVLFAANWLSVGGMENHELFNAEGFWNLTSSLVEKHAKMEIGAVPVADAVLQMVLEDHAGRAAQRGADSRQLHQHLRAVTPVLHHALDGLKVADRPRETIEHRLGLGVHMAVRVAVLLPGLDRMGVHMAVAVIVVIDFLFVFVHLLTFSHQQDKSSIQEKSVVCNPPRGIARLRRGTFVPQSAQQAAQDASSARTLSALSSRSSTTRQSGSRHSETSSASSFFG